MGTPTSWWSVFIPGRGDRIFKNIFLLGAELSPAIVAILECTKSTESGMRNFSQITDPRKQKNNSDPNELNVLFLGTPFNQEYAGQATLRNLSELEDPPEYLYDQRELNYIKI